MRAALLAAAVLLAAAAPAGAFSDNAFVGEVGLVATACPSNSLPADGRLLSVSDHDPLYRLIGNTYGGDEQAQTFALPDLRDKAPAAGLLYCVIVQGLSPMVN